MKYMFYTLLLTLLSCKTANNFYQGKVMDENGKPIEGVNVMEENGNERQTSTDQTGYFKLDRSPDWLGTLVFRKKGYETDTIPSVRRQAGEKVRYNFIENETTVVILKAVKSTEQ